MDKDFIKYLDFHRTRGGTGKIFNFNFIEYKEGFLKLDAEFTAQTLNPNRTVQGGMMTALLDDITSLLIIYESKGSLYPNSTNLHSLHHRPLFEGKVFATATIIKKGKNIATIKGELFNSDGKLAATLMHTVVLTKADFQSHIPK
ncbi:MAG: hypothetical protein CMG47_03645 [Candidatus Marinimicrobia bacterium]|nr:hypothetical protein [Candidatus Neomarinimicrobiota bacterium]|tara:strand:- start:3618 stop:4052 length:435 start_codon:yes stop_codon:yes gene_type:complete